MSGPVDQNGTIISAEALSKIYLRGREKVPALRDATFEIKRAEFLAIAGPSGSGKTTLLNLIGCMDAPTSGQLKLFGKSVGNFSEQQRTRIRRDQIGFVFQHFSLLPTLTVAENVALPAFFAGRKSSDRANDLL